MGRGNHYAAVKVVKARREVNHFGAALPDVVSVATCLGEPANQRVIERRTGQSDVVTDGNFFGIENFGEDSADTIGELLIYAFGVYAANVVSAKACGVYRHDGRSFPQCLIEVRILFAKKISCRIARKFFTNNVAELCRNLSLNLSF